MATDTSTSRSQVPPTPADDRGQVHQPPIRWPHPSGFGLAMVALWAAGLLLALLVPMSLVPLSVKQAPPADVWTAFAVTLAGAFVMIAASVVLWRRVNDAAVLIMGAIPGFSCIVGGVILTASKLTGS